MTSARSIAVDVSQRATITLVIDSGKIQKIQIAGDDEDDVLEVEMMLPFGFSSRPPVGSDVVLVQPDGDADQAVAVSAQHRDHRPTGLEEGEAALYTTTGIKVFLGADGSVHLGEKDPADFIALASKVDTEIGRLWTLLTGWTPTPNDGGAALKAAATSAQPSVASVASATVKAK